MSENKIATKADLQRMYNKMLPYLGGMPEMVANKFSKGDLYSTEERMIGQWIDGKPLYQKSFVGTFYGTTSDFVNIFDVRDLSIDLVFIKEAIAINSGGDTYFIPDSKTDLGYYNGYIREQTEHNWSVNMPLYLTLQYTKTTDSPISIGSDTDYSTEEKIVGTWIDGKPIWQKTYILPSEIQISSETWTSVNITENGIKSILKAFGNADYINSIKTMSASLISLYTGSEIKFLVSRDNEIFEAKYITIQYTKTTD